MKTVVQDLMEMISKVETDSVDKNMLLSVLKFMYLPKEKEQIIEIVSDFRTRDTAEKYFNETFEKR